MSTNKRHRSNAVSHGYKSHLRNSANPAELLEFPEVRIGQSYPRHYPYPKEAQFPLGEPMDVEDVALMLGCSPWTVRQRYLPEGLPHMRASARGRFVFYRQQVIDWILERQTKGGLK